MGLVKKTQQMKSREASLRRWIAEAEELARTRGVAEATTRKATPEELEDMAVAALRRCLRQPRAADRRLAEKYGLDSA